MFCSLALNQSSQPYANITARYKSVEPVSLPPFNKKLKRGR